MRVREGNGVTLQLHPDPISSLVVNLCADVFEKVHDGFEIDICTDGVCEQRVKRLTVLVIHRVLDDEQIVVTAAMIGGSARLSASTGLLLCTRASGGSGRLSH
jgi:hypothetical protein